MSIAFTRNGTKFELALDGSVKSGGKAFGTWTTNDANALEVTASDGGAVFAQPARWSTKENCLSVKPDGGDAVDLLAETDNQIQFRLKNNRLVVDPFPDDDEFSFALTGGWSLKDDFSALRLAVGEDVLVFSGGLNDSQSRFVWTFETDAHDLKKLFSLRFEGNWRVKRNDTGKGVVLAVFDFEYTLKGETTKSAFELPVAVTADTNNGNRLLFTYQRKGSDTTWGVAFAGRFTTKGGALIGYSAEVYDDHGQISSRFTIDLKGKVKNGSVATRNTLKFEVTLAGKQIDLTLSGRFNFTKSSITYSLQLNTSSKTGEISAISFGLKFTSHRGTTVELGLKFEAGGPITVSVAIGADIMVGGSRKGTAYAKFDMTRNGETFGINALFGISWN